MSAKILPFAAAPTPSDVASPLALFVRLGDAHKKLADLHAIGKLPAKRVVVEASRFRFQKDFVAALANEGLEVVLDTEAAELAALAKYKGQARHAPWAQDARPLGPSFFMRDSKVDVIRQIAEFAVQHKFHVVLAPTHYLGDKAFPHWLEVDRAACVRLREALDAAGGQHIAIDYPLIVPHVSLQEHLVRATYIQNVSDLPIDNVWIRASGLNSDPGPHTLKRYISAMTAVHNLGKPIIADHLGGLVADAAMACGAISGLAHGVNQRERFDAGGWDKPAPVRDDDAPFGRSVRIPIAGLNKSLTRDELAVLVSATGGRRALGCGDRGCCPHGYEDMVEEPRGHSAHQMFERHAALEKVPDFRRIDYFLSGPMTDAVRVSKQISALRPSKAEAAKLKIDVEPLMSRLGGQHVKLKKSKAMLEALHESSEFGSSRARAARSRVPKKSDKDDKHG